MNEYPNNENKNAQNEQPQPQPAQSWSNTSSWTTGAQQTAYQNQTQSPQPQPQPYATGSYNTYPYQQPAQPRSTKPKRSGIGVGAVAALLVCCLILGAGAGIGGALLVERLNAPTTEQSDPQLAETTTAPVVNETVNPPSGDTATFNKSEGTQVVINRTGIGSASGTVMSFTDVVTHVKDSVVEITTETAVRGSYFQQYVDSGAGSGVIIAKEGYVITNHHVIDGAVEISVTTKDGVYPATLVGSEAKSDIAVLKIEASGLQAAEFGSSAELVTGDSAIVIGNPLGLEFADTMTIGYVSATERVVQISEYIMTLIQVDAAVNPGNSGGPLINSQGQVVGVVNAKISQDAVEGIGFAIPIDTAMTIAQDLIDHGYVTNRPMLGITVQSISEQQAAYYGYEPGITVTEVSPGSCAEQGGMKVGDKILAFNGVEVSNATELNFEKDKCSVGDTVTITIERDGQQMDLTIVLSAGTAA